jgi:hypothetical protein
MTNDAVNEQKVGHFLREPEPWRSELKLSKIVHCDEYGGF